ncbi:uncharacterized protein LOC115702360 [Cannabis sativa]|uniref:SNRNP25 ubiquitin-like domain-containing protein n=1 Tax=Cannabis sativa TaxID=3483 RepID=A0A7J6E805_CANSA|nr:uncharacterized protein LOC115702360 [Cannabis sativa]KAF4354492.1 hypothetical protein F8388_022214 [Cannabis sativa]
MAHHHKHEDFAPRLSQEKPRRSLGLPLSPLMLMDSLSRKSSVSYDKLPEEPLKLSVLKLDGSSFDVQVTRSSTVAELKKAVEAVFSHLPQKGPEKISWPHIWGHFCLCYNGRKLILDTDQVKNHGIKDGDQLHFVRHVSISYNLVKKRPNKKGYVTSKQTNKTQSPSSSCGEEEQSEQEQQYMYEHKVQQCSDEGCFMGHHETRLSRLFGEWFSHCKCSNTSTTTSSVGKKRRLNIMEGLVSPASRLTSGFMASFKKVIQRCGEKCYPLRRRRTLSSNSKRYLVK